MAGFAAEIAYYLDHHLDGSDPERLERLRDRCAEEMRTGARHPRPRPRDRAKGDAGVARVRPYPDVARRSGSCARSG